MVYASLWHSPGVFELSYNHEHLEFDEVHLTHGCVAPKQTVTRASIKPLLWTCIQKYVKLELCRTVLEQRSVAPRFKATKCLVALPKSQRKRRRDGSNMSHRCPTSGQSGSIDKWTIAAKGIFVLDSTVQNFMCCSRICSTGCTTI